MYGGAWRADAELDIIPLADGNVAHHISDMERDVTDQVLDGTLERPFPLHLHQAPMWLAQLSSLIFHSFVFDTHCPTTRQDIFNASEGVQERGIDASQCCGTCCDGVHLN